MRCVFRPKFRAGYFQLVKYLLFTALYFTILTMQMKVDEVFKMDEVHAFARFQSASLARKLTTDVFAAAGP